MEHLKKVINNRTKNLIREDEICKNKITTVYIVALILLACIIVVSCGPAAQQRRSEQKLSKLIKKNPQLVSTDTLFKDTIIQPATVRERTELDLDSTSADNAITELTAKFIDDSAVADSINKGMRNIVRHAGDIDTNVTSGRTKLHIKKNGNKLTIDATTTPDVIKIKEPVVVNTVKPVPVISWYQNILLSIGKYVGVVGGILLFLLLLYIIYRVLKKAI